MKRTIVSFILIVGALGAQTCNLTGYRSVPGMNVAANGNILTVTWDGERNEEVQLRLTILTGIPSIQELSVRRKGGPWGVVGTNLAPEFSVVSGLRRMTDQQLKPLETLKVPITPAILDQFRWEAFWDAPLRVPGNETAHGGSTPPAAGVADQPGLPRKPEEIARATAVYHVTGCNVETNGQRVEISYPGVQMGIFDGALRYTIYKGSNLIRQEIMAKTTEKAAAYKYDAGIRGLKIQADSRMAWRDTSNLWQDYQLGGAVNRAPVTVRASNRLIVAQGQGGSIAAFPPIHNFYWAREIDYNLGNNYYRKDENNSFAFGIRQPEGEADPDDAGRGPEDRRQNFALRSARPGTMQRMPVYFYVSAQAAQATADSALAYSRQDHFKPIAGYEVLATHFHSGLVRRLTLSGSLDNILPDFEAMKAAGVTVFAPIDGGGVGMVVPGQRTVPDRLKTLASYYEVARLHSDKNFLIMPNEELFSGAAADELGGHNDVLISHPVFWMQGRKPDEPMIQDDPKYGKVYHVANAAEFMQMTHLEDMIVFMPHPRSKGSTGFPDAIKDTAHFRDENYRGVGFRWGMGLDGSETRLCDYRCMPLFDDMNNWVADLPTPPKYMQAISEVYQQGNGDDIYANNPVNYVKVASPPGLDNWKPIVDAMRQGDYFVTSGEVLITNWKVEGSGGKRTIAADVEWTFPMEFAEVVWGDGRKTDRQIISMTGETAFGKKHFSIPFDATGKKWVRFAAWDSAGEGAFVQPVKLAR